MSTFDPEKATLEQAVDHYIDGGGAWWAMPWWIRGWMDARRPDALRKGVPEQVSEASSDAVREKIEEAYVAGLRAGAGGLLESGPSTTSWSWDVEIGVQRRGDFEPLGFHLKTNVVAPTVEGALASLYPKAEVICRCLDAAAEGER